MAERLGPKITIATIILIAAILVEAAAITTVAILKARAEATLAEIAM